MRFGVHIPHNVRDRLDKVLMEVEKKIRLKAIRKGVREGAKVFKLQAQANAPVKSGKLRKSFVVKTRSNAKKGQFAAFVGLSNKYGRGHILDFLEKGTKGHIIAEGAIDGAPKKGIKHPGISPQPFLERSAKAAIPRALRTVIKHIQQTLNTTSSRDIK